jgi:hypothetical protein
MKRSLLTKWAGRALLAGLLLSSPWPAAAQPKQPGARPAIAPDTAAEGEKLTAQQAMDIASKADSQPALSHPSAPVANSPSVLAPIAPAEGPATAKEKGSGNWKWPVGIVFGLIVGFILARVLGRRSAEQLAEVEDQDARERRRQHQRGQQANPASREEQRLSKDMTQEFINAPMRQSPPALPARPQPEAPALPKPPARPAPARSPAPIKPKAKKPARPMPTDLTPPPAPVPPTINELIDATAPEAAPAPVMAPAPTGPVHYYAPAPDVPSIEHRKLSPNPLPQMPLLITLAQADATRADFTFSPQADQSRIIGNGVRELKEFFAFELPPTEQFTSIRNLSPGKLEKRDDTWHVVQKANIALS